MKQKEKNELAKNRSRGWSLLGAIGAFWAGSSLLSGRVGMGPSARLRPSAHSVVRASAETAQNSSVSAITAIKSSGVKR